MALSILGAQPLEELEAWARELFAAVPSGAGPRPTFPDVGSPYEARAQLFTCAVGLPLWHLAGLFVTTGLRVLWCRLIVPVRI